MSSVYAPIACHLHDRLLDLATRRVDCAIEYLNETGETVKTRTAIADVYSLGKEEFLKTASGTVIRLDRLNRVNDVLFCP